MAQRIVFPEKHQVELERFAPGSLTPGSVRVQTMFSLMSTGTEGIVLHGLFDEGTHWAKFVEYPFHPGYAVIGVVRETGAEISELEVGQLVAARLSHASEHVVEADRCTPVPASIPPEQASWFALAKIALMGARAAEYTLGDTVAVIGAGPIGQMSIRWARAAGATTIVAIDPVPERLQLAQRGGATHTVALPIDEAGEAVKQAGHGAGPRIVVDTTGNAAVFAAALGIAADRGRVVVLGDTGSPAGQHLTPDVVTRGVSIVGAHDSHSITADWDGDRGLHALFFRLVAGDRFSLEALNTHTFAPEEAQAAYDTATERRADTMGILFDWRRQ